MILPGMRREKENNTQRKRIMGEKWRLPQEEVKIEEEPSSRSKKEVKKQEVVIPQIAQEKESEPNEVLIQLDGEIKRRDEVVLRRNPPRKLISNSIANALSSDETNNSNSDIKNNKNNNNKSDYYHNNSSNSSSNNSSNNNSSSSDEEYSKSSSSDEESKELQREKDRCRKLEQLLETKRLQRSVLTRSLYNEREKFNYLAKTFVEEKNRRVELEKKLEVTLRRSLTNLGHNKQQEPSLRETQEKRRLSQDLNLHKKLDNKLSDTRSVGRGTHRSARERRNSYRRSRQINISLYSALSCAYMEETNLLDHILSLGHAVDNCPEIKVSRFSCRGYLQKMGKSKLRYSWKRRWFVFHSKVRAFCYFGDEHQKKSKGVLYFQSIQEIYVDSTIKRSPSPNTTFCVRTPTKLYSLAAPSAVAMSIWIHVICTGKEGVLASSMEM